MIAKEQTAKAIANAAHVYEKNGVEAALCEVRSSQGAASCCLCVILLKGTLAFFISLWFCSCTTFISAPFCFPLFCFCFSSRPQTEEVDPTKAQLGETAFTAQAEQPQDAKETEPAAQSSSQISEVEIPSVGKVPVRSDADGYNEEVQLPAQALIAVHH